MKQKSIKLNFIMNSVLSLSSVIFPLISAPYAYRVLMPEGIGQVTYVNAIISYFVLFAMLGIPIYGIRACAMVRDDKIALSKTVQELLLINIIMGVLSSVLLALCVIWIPQLREYKQLFLFMSITIWLNVLGVEWLYKALEQYTYITVRSVIFKFLSLVMLFVFVKDETDIVEYGLITVVASSGSYIMNFVNLHKQVTLFPMRHLEIKKHVKFVMIFCAMNVATLIYTNLDTVMLNAMCGDSVVGLYSAAVKIKGVLVGIVTSLAAVLMPRVAYYLSNKKYELFYAVSAKAINFIFLIGLPITIYFTMFSKPSILLLSGNSFIDAVAPMRIIMPTVFFIGLTNILGIQMLVPLKKEKTVLLSEIIGAIVDLVLNLIFIPMYGAAGAALGTLAAEFSVLIVQGIALRKYLKKIWRKISYAKLLVANLCSIGVGYLFLRYETQGLIFFILSGSCYFLIYSLILILLKEELTIEMVNQLLRMTREIKTKYSKKNTRV